MRKIIKDSIKLYKRGRIVFFLNATIWQWLCHSHTILIVVIHFNPIQDGLFWGCSQMGGGAAFWVPLPKIRHTYPTMMKLGTVIPYLRNIQKMYKSLTHTLSSAGISIFLPEIRKFCYIKKYTYRLEFDT